MHYQSPWSCIVKTVHKHVRQERVRGSVVQHHRLPPLILRLRSRKFLRKQKNLYHLRASPHAVQDVAHSRNLSRRVSPRLRKGDGGVASATARPARCRCRTLALQTETTFFQHSPSAARYALALCSFRRLPHHRRPTSPLLTCSRCHSHLCAYLGQSALKEEVRRTFKDRIRRSSSKILQQLCILQGKKACWQ